MPEFLVEVTGFPYTRGVRIVGAPRLSCAAMKNIHLDVALQAAAAAGRIIRKAYQGKFKVRYKADASPVTEVDEAAEVAIRTLLKRKFHGHGFYGEETGAVVAAAR